MKKKYKQGIVCVSIIIGVIILVATLSILFYEPSPHLDDEFIDTYSCVCNGTGVDIASEYNSSEEGIHPMILIQSDGTRHEWTDEVPLNWWPDNIIDVELVLVCDKEESYVVEVCSYYGPDITRYGYRIHATLRIAKTGAILAETTLYGEPPRECRQTESYSLTELWGEHVELDQLTGWLSPYIIT